MIKKAILIDDEPLAVALVQEYLQAHSDIEVVKVCHNGFEGMKAILEHHPDLVFLDVQMPKLTGFEMMELLEEPPAVIFTTAFDEYALKAFEAHAVDYLLKPFSRERFDTALQRWRERHLPVQQAATRELLQQHTSQPEEQQRVVVKSGNSIRIVPVPEIKYVEAFDDYVKIHTAEGEFLKKKTMAHFEQQLPATLFVRVHRSFLINIQEITRIEPMAKEQYVALLKDGTHIPLSKTGYPKLKEVLGL